MEISVIVPAYNVSKYVDRFCYSILQQTFDKQFEVIIVNDGSTDNTKDIIEFWQNKYPNIFKIFNKDNGGQSTARNLGLEKAIGDYVAFIDSDDYVSQEYLNTLYEAAIRENAEVSMCAINRVYGDDGKGRIFDSGFCKTFTTKDVDYVLKHSSFGPWAKLFKKSLFVDGGDKFPEGITYEDFAFIPQLMNRAKTITYTHKVMYHYFVNMNSTIMSKRKTTDMNIIKAQHILEQSELSRKPYLLENFYIRRVLASMCHSLILNREDINIVRSLVDEAIKKYPSIKGNTVIKNSSFYKRIFFILLLSKQYLLVTIWVHSYDFARQFVKKLLCI